MHFRVTTQLGLRHELLEANAALHLPDRCEMRLLVAPQLLLALELQVAQVARERPLGCVHQLVAPLKFID